MRTLGPGDLVLCTTTVGPRPLREFLSAARAAGFAGISLSGGDYRTARASGLSDADIRALLEDHNLAVADLDSAVDWFRPLPRQDDTPFDLSQPFFGHSVSAFLDMAGAVGARSLGALDPFPVAAPVTQMAEGFAALCDRAAEQNLLVHLEHLSWGPIPNLATAWEIVHLANRENGGLLLDTLHLMRSGSRGVLEDIPAGKIFATQFCDGPATPTGNLFEDANNRLLPGDGVFDLPVILRHLNAHGCKAPLGAEIMSTTLAALPALEIAKQVYAALTRLQAAAHQGSDI